MITCNLTREQLLEALEALNIAHENGWINSKAIFSLKSFDERSGDVWKIDKNSDGDIELIVDGGTEKGELNFVWDTYLYKEETPESMIKKETENEN